MQNVPVMECGDAQYRARVASLGPTPAAKTSAYTILATDAGAQFTNKGATAAVTFTLPAAVSGFMFSIDKVADPQITVTGGTINGGSSFVIGALRGLYVFVCDGTEWVVSQPGQGIQYAEVTISAADIVATGAGKLGHANGYPLVAAPGAGAALELVSAVLIFDYATAAYTGGGNVSVNWAGGGAAITGVVTNANSIGASADKIVQFLPLSTAGNALSANTGINLVAASAFTQPGTAAGVVRMKVMYRVHKTDLA